MVLQRRGTGLVGAMAALVLALTAATCALAQPAGDGASMTGQLVESRKGYVARIPTEFRLDSASSGWNPKKRYEVRVYRYWGVGLIRLTVTVRTAPMPRDTVNDGTYIYTQADSATDRGTAISRTFYLPTRNVKIEIIPQSIRMARYLEAAPEILASFRWKPGATSEMIETDPPAPKGDTH